MAKLDFKKQRENLVTHLKAMGYVDSSLIEKAMLKVKREQFVWEKYRNDAYSDTPLPIPGKVTISAPHMHAIFMSALQLKPGDKVLEVGAGSGILLAYMKEVVGTKGEVYGIEIIEETYKFAKKNLEKAGYGEKVKLVLGDGSKGLPKYAPYDKIVSGASAPKTPKSWIEQLKTGGLIVTPIGPTYGEQSLIRLKKTKEGKVKRENLGGVIFVPLVGEFGYDY